MDEKHYELMLAMDRRLDSYALTAKQVLTDYGRLLDAARAGHGELRVYSSHC